MSAPDPDLPTSPDALLAELDRMGFATTTVEHPPLHTVEESQALRGDLPGGHTKNLFLKDKKGRLFLVTAGEETAVNLKQLHHHIGASGRVSFGRPDQLLEVLGVLPGAVTALALLNDTEGRVAFTLDAALLAHETVNCHPLVNTRTTAIATADLLAFARATGHEPNIVPLGDL